MQNPLQYDESRNSKKIIWEKIFLNFILRLVNVTFSQLKIVNNCLMTFLDDLRFIIFLQTYFFGIFGLFIKIRLRNYLRKNL